MLILIKLKENFDIKMVILKIRGKKFVMLFIFISILLIIRIFECCKEGEYKILYDRMYC